MRRKQREKLEHQAPRRFVIEGLSHEGRGIAHYIDTEGHPVDKIGKKVFVSFALPQEIVTAKITESLKKYEEADPVTVENPSPKRITPICPHFGVCGGCSLQHMEPTAQILFKQSVLAEHFLHFGGLKPLEWLPPLQSKRTDYRRKARLGAKYVYKKQSMLLGFRERKSGWLAELNVCKVLDAQIGERFVELKQMLTQLEGREHIPQLEMAVGDDTVAMIVRHLQPLSAADETIILEFARPLGWQVYGQAGGYDSVKRLDEPNGPMRLHYALPEFDLTFAFSPLDFTQVNADINQQMIPLALDLLDLKPGERVLDLFCGLGNFTLPLARRVGPTGAVIGVEGSADMVARGFENAALNNIQQVQFVAQDLTQDFSQKSWATQGFDALLIDPPRSGAEEVMRYLPRFGARRIVYVSCNPATLARDAGILAEQGYRLTKAGVMDMFTHTSHVESIALFEKI